jgi:hypothetical protein
MRASAKPYDFLPEKHVSADVCFSAIKTNSNEVVIFA